LISAILSSGFASARNSSTPASFALGDHDRRAALGGDPLSRPIEVRRCDAAALTHPGEDGVASALSNFIIAGVHAAHARRGAEWNELHLRVAVLLATDLALAEAKRRLREHDDASSFGRLISE
jgi:hypothetical protein